ncbi:hypothetical protein [Streptomyces specialis]|uniref:hypothetical protein n=1 Tax=Streptomyces specialis TaxID=498367 RepID=UPI00073F6508|nr:hypothetical protein [Streptomyces specialis]
MQRNRITALATVAILTVGIAHATAQESTGEPSPGDGAAPLAEHVQLSGDYIELAPGGIGTATVACPGGTQPTGGGFRTTAFDIHVTDSTADGFDWIVIGRNEGSTPESLRATVICTAP